MMGILPIAIIAAIPLILLSAATAEIVDRGLLGRSITTAIAASCAGALGYGVTFGRHFQQIPLRIGFIASLLSITAIAVWFLLPITVRALRKYPNPIAIGSAGAVILIEIVNQLVLPRLYPAFHIALSAIAIVLVGWASTPLARAFPESIRRRSLLIAAGAVIAISACAIPLSMRVLTSWDNTRILYLSHAPTLSHAIRIAAALHPSETHDGEFPIDSVVDTDDESTELDWRDRSILLITVDAMRADRLGTYGYNRNTTPNIDKLAEDAVVFEHAYTVMPHTSYAIASILTGKYMRPLLTQGTGQDSDTLAKLLRTIGYRTAAFYPPSLFAIDADRFDWAKQSGFDFEYRKLEYADAPLRIDQVIHYLDRTAIQHPVFLWAHFLEPHEPYTPPPQFNFGPNASDRYDGEIAAVDDAIGQLVREVLKRRANTIVMIASDHGEAFGEHGSYYHGTTVYEEQTRVPLIILAHDLDPTRIKTPVQLIDIMPTVLRSMGVPRRPRVRGTDISPLLTGHDTGDGFAFSETHDQALIAEGKWRLICERKIDACLLFDIGIDPKQLKDISAQHPERFARMRQQLRTLDSSHGTYERSGSRTEGKDLPASLIRGLAGDTQAAEEVAALLDDADVVLRRKAAEALFELAQARTTPSLSLAVSRDEDEQVRRWCAITLTRIGHGAPLTTDLVASDDPQWRRLAALALAESGDGRGEAILVNWWESGNPSIERRKELTRAFANIRARSAVVPMVALLDDIQLRPSIADALSKIGEPYAKIPLLRTFTEERYVHSRLVLANALVALGASRELAPPLVRFLGTPDPLHGGVAVGMQARILDALGGPSAASLDKLAKVGPEGVDVQIIVPLGGNRTGYRVIVRAEARDDGAFVRFGRLDPSVRYPRLDPEVFVRIPVPRGVTAEVHAPLSNRMGAKGGRALRVMLVPDLGVRIEAFVIVPFADDIPPPAPEPWSPDDD
ncbi:MAG: sulfatase-like hydrolase/transferase [Polyangiaceae bacterium]|nr:sulfatase-like hydrolase/transferase [Polyangiaceae bacterium]